MSIRILYFIAAFVVGIAGAAIGFIDGRKNYRRFLAESAGENVLAFLGSIPLPAVLIPVGLEPSGNTDKRFAEVIKYQKDTLPAIINLASKERTDG